MKFRKSDFFSIEYQKEFNFQIDTSFKVLLGLADESLDTVEIPKFKEIFKTEPKKHLNVNELLSNSSPNSILESIRAIIISKKFEDASINIWKFYYKADPLFRDGSPFQYVQCYYENGYWRFCILNGKVERGSNDPSWHSCSHIPVDRIWYTDANYRLF
jgi:hypothetical protein